MALRKRVAMDEEIICTDDGIIIFGCSYHLNAVHQRDGFQKLVDSIRDAGPWMAPIKFVLDRKGRYVPAIDTKVSQITDRILRKHGLR